MSYALNRDMVRVAALVALAIFIVFYYYFKDPAVASFSIPCLFHAVTGWSCWGCGGQRAFHQLLHGHWSQALQLNALVFPVTALMGFVLLSELTQKQSAYTFLRQRNIQFCAITILVGFTVLRNLF